MAIELEALEDDDIGPETLVLNLVATGAEPDNGPGEQHGDVLDRDRGHHRAAGLGESAE